MSWQSIWSVAELLKRLSVVSSGPNLLNTAQPVMTDDSWDCWSEQVCFLIWYTISPIFSLSQNALDQLWTELDFQVSPCSPLSFPSSLDPHTHTCTHKHTWLPEETPCCEWEEVVCLIRLSSSPGDGSHPPGSGEVCPISPSTPHTSTQGWRVQLCLCACAGTLCVYCAEMRSHACISLPAVCVHTWVLSMKSGGQRGQFRTSHTVNLITTQPADDPRQIDQMP